VQDALIRATDRSRRDPLDEDSRSSCPSALHPSLTLPLYVGLNIGTSAQVSARPEVAASEQITREPPSRIRRIGSRRG
jgi:hypothetical protein